MSRLQLSGTKYCYTHEGMVCNYLHGIDFKLLGGAQLLLSHSVWNCDVPLQQWQGLNY